MDRPRISVAVTTYKRARYLELCLSSILNQTVLPDEIVVSEDACDEGTSLVVQRLSNSGCIIRHITNVPPMGQLQNRQQAVRLCTGEYVAILDDDDLWDKTFLERTLDILMQHNECGFCSSDHYVIDKDNTILLQETEVSSKRFGRVHMDTGVYHDVLVRELLEKPFPLQFTLFRRNVLELVGYFPDYGGVVPDFALFALLGANRISGYFLSERLGMYRTHVGQQTVKRVENAESLVHFLLQFASKHSFAVQERRVLAALLRLSVVELAIARAHRFDRAGAFAALKEFPALGWGSVKLSRLLTLIALLVGVRREASSVGR